MCAYNKLTYNILIDLSLGVYHIIFYAARLLVVYINELRTVLSLFDTKDRRFNIGNSSIHNRIRFKKC